MIIQHNMAAQNILTQYGITNDKLRKATERLSSGYKVNRAADNAAALAVSEKKRAQIRGLNRAAKNAQDGISFVQTGDGAMSQMAAMLHRMRELTVQALNDAVYQPEDQAAMQMEFDQLQGEIDRVNDQTEFNKKIVFEHYAGDYSTIEGNRVWSQNQYHTIDSSNSSLTVNYVTVAEDGTEMQKQLTLTIPEGTYTTQELMDEMDDVVTALGDKADGLCLEYTDKHTCNMVLQNGKEVRDVSGGLSYLFFDSYGGNKSGALIGTTVFYPGNPLMVKAGKNDELRFRIDYFDGTSRDVFMKVAEDGYTRGDMIRYLNQYTFPDGKKLADYGMQASEYGSASIQLGGESGIITGLKGNMFEIDDEHYDSVFYDNTKYGSATEVPAVFTGADVLNEADLNHAKFQIVSGQNDILSIRVDGGTFETIQLDAGDYTISGMVAELQKKLDAKNLGLKVTSHLVNGVITPNGNKSYRFAGLTLTGSTIGKGGKIEFDVPNSSAYETLFVRREYTDTGVSSVTTAGVWDYTSTSPSVTGGREFDSSVDFPLTLKSASNNNSFTLEVTEAGQAVKKQTITLEGTFGDLNDLISEINNQIGKTEYKDKIMATRYGNQIRLTIRSGNDTISKINVARNSSDGYNVLFVGESIEWPTVKETTLLPVKPGPDGKITFSSGNNKLIVNVGGSDRIVEIPPGSYTPEKVVEILNDKDSVLKGKTIVGESSHGSSTYAGNTVSKYTSSESGTEKPYQNTGADGTGGKVDGSTQIKDGTPAWYKLGGTLPATTTIDGTNDRFTITVNGRDCNVTLGHKSYSRDQMARELQDKINAQMSEANKVKVTVTGGQLKFETAAIGEGRTITVGNSTFLSSVNTSRTKGYTTTTPLSYYTFPLNLSASNNKFTIKIDGVATTVDLDTTKTYSKLEDIQTELNAKLSAKGVAVTQYGGGLKFERTTAGKGSVSLDMNNCGPAGAVLFKSPGTATMSPVTIPKADAGKPGTVKYSVTVGGTTYTTTLTNTASTPKTYTPAELQAELDKAVWRKNDTDPGKSPADLGFSISTVGTGSIRFTTVARGTGQTITAGARSGPVVTVTPTIDASLTKNPDGTIGIGLKSNSYFRPEAYNKGSVLQPQKGPVTVANPWRNVRDFDTAKCTLKTRRPVALPGSVSITDDNNKLHFSYRYQNGTWRDIDITLDKKTYTRAQLQQELQSKLDAAIENDPGNPHPGEGLKVTVGDQITMESKRDGRFQIRSLSGGFYERIMMGTEIRSRDEKTVYKDGRLVVDDVYIAGRKDIRNKSTRIEKGENDELNLDITINGNVTTLNMVLDPGTYDSDSLVKQIQEKLAEQLKAANLPENMVQAGIGVYDSGVEGTDDKNSLFFYLNKDTVTDPGTYAIDGLSGKALFSVFYKTDGDPIPAYVTGTKDISGGVEVRDGENEFSVDVDGKTFTYQIPSGTYDTPEELVETLNKVIQDANDGSFIKAGLSGNMLKIAYTKLGEHKIGNIQGSAKIALFYKTTSRYGEEVDEWLQIGANDRQGTKLERFSMSTLSMGINSLSISRPKYANKALGRIDDALKWLSTVRSRYGALENRLEYAVKVDNIAAENTQSSESRDRDADMAAEMVEYAKGKILQHAGESMMVQANQHTQSVLSLLN